MHNTNDCLVKYTYIYIPRYISVAILAQVPLPLCLKSFNSGPWPAAMLNHGIRSLHLFLIGSVCFHPQFPYCSAFSFALSSLCLMQDPQAPLALAPLLARPVRRRPNLPPRVRMVRRMIPKHGVTKSGMIFAPGLISNLMDSKTMLRKLSTRWLENKLNVWKRN